MKKLQLAPRVPFPEDDGGKISIANITKIMHNLGEEVTLIFYDAEPEKLNIPNYAADYAEIAAYILKKIPKRKRARKRRR